jgi:hypothetical protein
MEITLVTYKIARTDHKDAIAKYCEDAGVLSPIEEPGVQAIFIALDENNVIIGISAVKHVIQVEPLVCSIPMVAHVLGEKALALASTLSTNVEALVNGKDEQYINLLVKYGFEVTDKNMVILKKEL